MVQEPRINADRLLLDLRQLASIGKSGSGVRRPAYSDADVAARFWLAEKFSAAGLDMQIDRVGNVFGRWPGVSRAILLGSHTDTVPHGGWLDGALGVIYALEVARALSEAKAVQTIGVDIVSFADEEGMFAGWFGSRTFCGDFEEASWSKIRNHEGRTLSDALTAFKNRPRLALNPTRNVGYLEAHIEQGPRLEALGKPIGIVTSIVGIRTRRLHFLGRADHAGTTPMTMRKDAGKHLVALLARLRTRFEQASGKDTVWNFGNIVFKPGVANVVPAEAELLVQYRDSDSRNLAKFDGILEEEIGVVNTSEPGCCTVSTTMVTEPVLMDTRFQKLFREAAVRKGHPYEDLPSGAGHDAAALAAHIPIGMLFIPSIAGRSHTPEEDTAEKDIIAGAEVMLAATEQVLQLRL